MSPPCNRSDPSRRERDDDRVAVLGLAFDRVTQEALVDRIAELVRSGDGHWVLTANVQHVGEAARNPALGEVLRTADVVTADGMPILWAARLRGDPLPERVTGADLVVPLARRCAEEGWRLFLAGGAPGVAERLAERLVAEAPGLAIVGTATPPHLEFDALMASEENAALVERIRAARPEVLLLALGTPKQERWIAAHVGRLGVPVAVGVGAAFDFLVGGQRRAPRWMRAAGAEWLHRAVSQPRRLVPRYARNGLTLMRLLPRELRRPRP